MIRVTARVTAKAQAIVQKAFEHLQPKLCHSLHWRGGIETGLAANYLQEQLSLAVSQRAAGKPQDALRSFFTLAVPVLR